MILHHALRQGAGVGALVRVGLSGLGTRPSAVPSTPGAPVIRTVSPRAHALLQDYARWSGGSSDTVPPHLFSQWCFPALSRTLMDLPWPLVRVLNQGCRLTVHGPLPAGEPLQVRAWLEGVDEQPHKVRLHQVVHTGPASQPDALVADVYAVVPTGRREGGGRERPRVPGGATPVARVAAERGDGLRFACLTGDFNPIHWLPPYARMAGFDGPILHGFGLLARTWEALVAGRLAGRDRIATMDVRFVRPTALPSDLGVYLGPGDQGVHDLAVGPAPGGPANLLGTVRFGALDV